MKKENKNTKKPKGVEKNVIKAKLVTAIEGLLSKSDQFSTKKVKKTIKKAASEISKKFTKALKKAEKKGLKDKKPVAKRPQPAKGKTKTKLVKARAKANAGSNGKGVLELS